MICAVFLLQSLTDLDISVFAAEAILLAFQHYLTMVGTAVLIPLLIFQSDTGVSSPVSYASL